jgi:polyisoprenoid-binding protein YceI
MKFHYFTSLRMLRSAGAPTRSTLALSALLSFSGSLQAQSTVRYEAQPGSKVKVEGTSTLHDWTIESRAVGGFMELDPSFDADLKTVSTIPKVEVTIPVRQLKNPENKPKMDAVMYEHMRQKEQPTIKYRLLGLTPKAGASSQFDAKGELTVAGITRTNSMPVTFERIDPNKIKVKGATPLKMSDFGIQPPALTIAGIGIKTGDEVKLNFEWTTAKPEKGAEAK